MKISSIELGPVMTNVYFILDEATNKGAIVDPSVPDPHIPEIAEKMGMEVEHILLTHGHFDHILGVPYAREQFPKAKIVISEKDAACLTDPKDSLAAKHFLRQEPITPDLTVKEGDEISLGTLTFRVMETPGHTPGSILYLEDREKVMLAGDTVFQNSYGRTDLYRGNPNDMQASLYRIGQLPINYTILPGHGPTTTLEHEKMVNPYMTRTGVRYEDDL